MMFSFVISVLVSSFLLFQIQPLLAKYILPWFGGTSGVWSASLLFFQGFLTVGYGYAHWLTTRLSRRLQGQIHLAFLGISIVLLAVNAINWESPILPGLSRHPSDVFNPIIDVIQSLFIAVGIPYCLLSSNSTIMQDWFLLKNRNRSPYPLYAVSNAGSLVGLISYPFFIEPLLRVVDQSYIWIGGYLLFILVTGHHAWTVQGWESPTKAILSKGEKVDRQKSNLKRNFSWLFLSGLASMLLLATTNQITQEVASIPLLWVLPFSVYLISFVLAFSNGFLYRRLIFVGFLLLCTILFVWFLELSTSSIYYQIAVYLALLFVCTMICLGELYQRRPNTDSITQFYLMISIGGAMGGIAVNMLFPRIFTGLWEHQLGVGLVWILVFYLLNNQPVSNRYYVNQSLTAIVGLATIVVFATLYFKMDSYEKGARISIRNFFIILNN